ncbi:hypothetical protein R6Q57_010591 [Mikania cordata]
MGHKHLHELLKEDQEPFHLKNYIADRRSQLRSTTSGAGNTALNLRKPKPIIESTSSSATTRNFCINHVCLFSFKESPEFMKSPFLDFPARELKSPCHNAAMFLHIPATTAGMLLDAAARVQKKRPGSKQIGLGLLGSFLRRLKDRSTRTKTREIGLINASSSSLPARRSRKKAVNGDCDKERLSHSCNDSIIWSEKSSELETSCSSRSVHEYDEIECFCSNPSSPFRFSLQRSPSPVRREPESSPSVTSAGRRFKQDKESYEVECPQEVNRQKDEEKEQCSPVSVLDPLFDDGEDEERDDGTIVDDYDIKCSYASVQRAKYQLLQKLQRFERLAGLDPIKLENHLLEQCYNEDEDALVNGVEEVNNEEVLREIVNYLGVTKIPWYLRKLVLDLMEEENKNEEHHVIVQRVCKRLHLWKVVELNTIDMMVETDFKNEGWNTCEKETTLKIGLDVEATIFGLLVEELVQDLVIIDRRIENFPPFLRNHIINL